MQILSPLQKVEPAKHKQQHTLIIMHQSQQAACMSRSQITEKTTIFFRFGKPIQQQGLPTQIRKFEKEPHPLKLVHVHEILSTPRHTHTPAPPGIRLYVHLCVFSWFLD